MQLPDLARRHGAAVGPHQTRIDPRYQRAYSIVASRRLHLDGCDSRGAFGNAIAVAEWQPEFRLDFGFERHIERCAGDGQPAKLAAGELVDSGDHLVLQQPLKGGRHAEQQRDAIIGDRGNQRGGIEARHQLHGSAGHQRGDQDGRQTDDMRYRQNAVDLVGRLALRARRPRAEQQVAVGEHYSFGVAGRAGGIDECRDLA